MPLSRIRNELLFIPVMFYFYVYSRDLDCGNVSPTYKFSYICMSALEIMMSQV